MCVAEVDRAKVSIDEVRSGQISPRSDLIPLHLHGPDSTGWNPRRTRGDGTTRLTGLGNAYDAKGPGVVAGTSHTGGLDCRARLGPRPAVTTSLAPSGADPHLGPVELEVRGVTAPRGRCFGPRFQG